ncbi:cytoplasmic polyadenylation element-binding protein [Battus philenor]|uniref:cytoplasmic polyadenylation element-binding protein n=1 Tax=Battus philenor TaxID=42288 RepID=UPI0035CF6CAA
MPLLRKDIGLCKGNGRGGGTRNNRLSRTSLYNLDASQPPGPDATPNLEQSPEECGVGSGTVLQRDWPWNDCSDPASPEAAQTPMSLVPLKCFPPQHPTAFASYSETARPGEWSENASGQWSGTEPEQWNENAPGHWNENAPGHWSENTPQQWNENAPGHWNENAPQQWSENAPAHWSNNSPGQVSDLVDSLNHLSMAPTAPASDVAGVPQIVRAAYEGNDKNQKEPSWPHDQSSAASAPSLPQGGVARRGSDEILRWCGALPPRGVDSSGGYSAKVFLGGLPWDISEDTLMHALKIFIPVRVEWPGREGNGGVATGPSECAPRGFAYVTLENERRVRSLLSASRRDGYNWYYRIASRNMRTKEVQVIPWAVCDSNWVSGGSTRLEPGRTVFVGALHGMLSAYALALIMNDLFSGVVYAGIDTDKNKYPIGSGRVTFNNVHSYVRAISAAFIEVSTEKFTKTIQVDPYLEDSMCSVCNLKQGPYFCRDPLCFRYYCRSCWAWQHREMTDHKQLMRNSKGSHNGASILPPQGSISTSPLPRSIQSTSFTSVVEASPSNSNSKSRKRSEKRYQNGYRRASEGTPSPPNSGTSEVSNVNEAILEPWI